MIGKQRQTLNGLRRLGAKVEVKRKSDCYVYGNEVQVNKVVKEIESILNKHRQMVLKSQQERDRLKEENCWLLQNHDFLSTDTSEIDYAMFNMARKQHW